MQSQNNGDDAEDKAVSAVKSLTESENFKKLLQDINEYYEKHRDSKETVGLLLWHNLGSITKFLGFLIARPSIILSLISFFRRPQRNTTQFVKRVVEETKILEVVTEVGGGTLVKNLAGAFQATTAGDFADASVMTNLFSIVASSDKRDRLIIILNSVLAAINGKAKWIDVVAIILNQIDQLPELKIILHEKSELILNTLKSNLMQKGKNGNELTGLGKSLENMGIISVKKDENGNLTLDTMLLDKALPAVLNAEKTHAMQLLSSIVDELGKPEGNLFAWVHRTVQLINSNAELKTLVKENPELLTKTLTKFGVSIGLNEKTFEMLFGILIPTASELLKEDDTTNLLIQILGAMERSPGLFKSMMNDISIGDHAKLIDDLLNDKVIAAFLSANPNAYKKFLQIVTEKATTLFAGSKVGIAASLAINAPGIHDPMNLKNIAKGAIKIAKGAIKENIVGVLGNIVFSDKSNKIRVDFSNMELTGDQLKRIINDLRKLHGPMMGHSEHVDIIFEGTKITGSIDDLDLSGLNLSGLDLSGVTSMEKCDLTGATIDKYTLFPKGKEIAKPSKLEFEKYQLARDIAIKVWENLFGDSTNSGRIEDLNKMMKFFMGTMKNFDEGQLEDLRTNVLKGKYFISEGVTGGKNNDLTLNNIIYNLATSYTVAGLITSGIQLDGKKLETMKDCVEQFFRVSLIPLDLDTLTYTLARDLSEKINKKLFGLEYVKYPEKVRAAQEVEKLIINTVSGSSNIKESLRKSPAKLLAVLIENKNIDKLQETLDYVTKFGFDDYEKIKQSAHNVAVKLFGENFENNAGRIKDFNHIFELLLEKLPSKDLRFSTEPAQQEFESTLEASIRKMALERTWAGVLSGGVQLKPEKLDECWEEIINNQPRPISSPPTI